MEKKDINSGARDRASYEPNSHIYKEGKEKRKIEPVAKGKVSVKKQPVGKRFLGALFANNSKSIKEYIIEDVLLPNIRDLLYSMGVGSLGMLLLGEDVNRGGQRARGNGYSYDKVSYAQPRVGSKKPVEEKKRLDYREIIFDSRVDAEDTLNALKDYLYDYGNVSLLNFYEFAGVDEEAIRFTDDEYGWFNLDKAHVIRDRNSNGYLIDLPRAISLD